MPRNEEVGVLGKSLIFAPYGTERSAVMLSKHCDATHEGLHFYCAKLSDLYLLSLLPTL